MRRWADWLGLVVTWAALLGLGISGFGGAARTTCLAAMRLAVGWVARHRTMGWIVSGIIASGMALGLVVASSARLAEHPLQPQSLFAEENHTAVVTMRLGDVPCRAVGHAAWQCGDRRVEAAVRSGLYGAHVCMAAPTEAPLTILVEARMPSFVNGRYDTGGGAGLIRVDLGDHEIGRLATRDQSQGLQFFQFDLRAEARPAAPAPIRITLEGAPLHCFDLSLVP